MGSNQKTMKCLNINSGLEHQRVLATALLHEASITMRDIERVELGQFTDAKYKRIVATVKELYVEPHKQPKNKQIADAVHQDLLGLGYAQKDADREADALENLNGYKRMPDAVAIAKAIENLSIDTGGKYGLFEFKSGSEGYDQEFSYLIKGYLPSLSLGMIYGASGSYKSFHALSWACHVALGQEWNGCRVNQQPVLYIAGEGGIGVPRRIRALELQYNDGNKIPNFYRLDFAVAMGDVNQVNQLAETIKHYSKELNVKFGLVIIDTLARCFGNGDENKTDDMGRFVSACDRIKSQANVTVMVVHHSGVSDKGRARGSSALRAACDFEYRVERTDKGECAYILSHTKSKDDREQCQQLFSLKSQYLFVDSDGESVVSLAALNIGQEPPAEGSDESPVLTEHEQTLYQIVRTRQLNREGTGIVVVRDDMKAQGVNVSNFSRWLKGAITKGVITKEDDNLVTVSLRPNQSSLNCSSSLQSPREKSDEEQETNSLEVVV
ncbi:hypothetical protein BCS95_11845 [Vibrio breoganii]|uniref:helicase RepA family protein n=1 Tax=Vibrio breoganii TaxID=553239 RepID=UPI000CC40592|nr:helicase RepA family protein [Vibrio breoganii]PMP02167.1 hypothetical protein BCS95_11845 [Vibrio breoganii]